MELQNSKLSFYGVDIIETVLQVERRFNFEGKIDLKAEAKLVKPSEDGNFKIVMTVRLYVDDYFSLTVKGVGNFQIESSLSQKEQKDYIDSNAPAIMFPYIRSFISTLSSNCGQSLPTLVIPPQFFQGKLDELSIENNDILSASQ